MSGTGLLPRLRRRPMSKPAAPARTSAGSTRLSPRQPSSTPRGLSSSRRRTCRTSTGTPPAHLTNYEPIIGTIAALTTAFARPVLLFNGDSHLYRSDNPLSPTAPCAGETDPATGMSVCAHDPNNTAWSEHPSYNVPNFHQIVVHGSTLP